MTGLRLGRDAQGNQRVPIDAGQGGLDLDADAREGVGDSPPCFPVESGHPPTGQQAVRWNLNRPVVLFEVAADRALRRVVQRSPLPFPSCVARQCSQTPRGGTAAGRDQAAIGSSRGGPGAIGRPAERSQRSSVSTAHNACPWSA